MLGRRITRREAVRAGAVAAGVSVGAGVLAACSTTKGPASSAAPAANQPVTELRFMPWWVFWQATGKSLLQEATAQFDQTHKGLRLTAVPGPQGGGASTSTVLADILAGTAPDVVADCCTAWASYMSVNAFADLTPYLRQDNISLGTWAKAQTAALATPQGQFGLPVYNGPVVISYRQDLLDSLGLPYPDPSWDYKAAADLWTRASGEIKSGSSTARRYGAAFLWSATNWYAMEYLLHGFGGSVMNAAGTQAQFSQQGSIDAAKWVYNLIWSKVIDGGSLGGSIKSGRAVFGYTGGWGIHSDALNYQSFKWAYLPMPKWPGGNATFNNDDYWGLVSTGKNLSSAWEVLKWLTYDDYWQQFCMKATLLAPTKVALWSQFQTQLEASAPVLKGKGLEYFVQAAQQGYGYPTEFFKYETTKCFAYINEALSSIDSHKQGVSQAFQDLTTRLDAVEATGAAQEATASKVATQVKQMGSSTKNITLATPAMTGFGLAPVAVPKQVSSKNGVWTVIGAGSDVGGTSDNGTLAAAADTNSVGTWTCRVTALQNISCPHPEPWCKVGIMARGDLSNDAPMIVLGVTSGNGLQLLSRTTADAGAASQTGKSTTTTGLIGQPLLTSAYTKKASNYLIHDIWLRLQRTGDTWQAWSSLDGSSWAKAGSSHVLIMAGAWVGIFVSAVNAGFANGAGMQIQASFDKLTFTPKQFVRLGNP